MTIRDENPDPRPYHGLEAIKFESSTNMEGIPVCIPGQGRVIAGWRMWSNDDPDILYVMKREGLKFSVFSWNISTGAEDFIAGFEVPEIGSYVEFKRFTPLGNIVVAFRETPHLYLIDVHNKEAKYIRLPTRLKDASIRKDEKIVRWANCYTYEIRWKNLETGEEGLAPGFSAGHASHGSNGMVANFGGHLNVFVSDQVGMTWTPGDLISVWANWKNDIVTDYGRLTDDNAYVFTNGTRHDVKNQHLMIPSADPGAVMRVARYFTRFSWTSTTYSRPSPDYTKLIYNENMIGSTELQMVYTRRPDLPVEVKLENGTLTWSNPERNQELLGYNIYGSNQSGRNFTRINAEPVLDNKYLLDSRWKYYAVTSLEYSGLESSLSQEVSKEGPRSFYFEAEEMEVVSPARRFFDGYCNNFQCIRINAESEEENARQGVVRISLNNIPEGPYKIWARVKGDGEWSVQSEPVFISSGEWEWVQLGTLHTNPIEESLEISSDDDALKLDIILLTIDEFIPEAPSPFDGVAPGQVKDLSARSKGNQVHISWVPVNDPDLHHYSVYCGKSEDFECNNETVVRSVLKTSVTDVLPGDPGGLYYKVVAVDNRWNESVPATVRVQ